MATADTYNSGPARRTAAQAPFPWIPALFLIGLVIPLFLNLGPVRLSFYRVVLLLVFVPAAVHWLSGTVGRVRGFDVCLVLGFLWAGLALFVARPDAATIEPVGILLLEALGPYLLARSYIRSRVDFERVMRLFLWIVAVLFPFALFESLTGRPILIELAWKIGPSVGQIFTAGRLGLDRAQVVFDHPILYGALASAGLASAIYLHRRPGRRLGWSGLVAGSTFLSLSSGALLALMVQIGLFAWDRATRRIPRRWLIFGLLALAGYVVVDLASNRTPFHVVVSYLTFNSGSAYNRILIFEHGMQNVRANPVFGLGFDDWARPYWMGASVDNFWLLIAMRYGIPAFALIVAGVVWLMVAVGCRRIRAPERQQARYAYMVALSAMIFAGMTVHYWNAAFAFFMFLLGSGVWLTHGEDEPDEDMSPDTPAGAPGRQRHRNRRSFTEDGPRPRRAGAGAGTPARGAPGYRRPDLPPTGRR